MNEARILVVEDEESQRSLLETLLTNKGFEVLTAAGVHEAFTTLEEARPNLLLTDYNMPDGTGLEVLRKARETDPDMGVVLLTAYGTVPMAVEAMRQGALDFMRKPVNESDFIERIAQALDQEAGHWHQKHDREQLMQRLAELTEREQEVFAEVAEGKANKMIAAELGISERTVEVHRAQVMKKLDARNLAQLVRIFLQTRN